MQLSVRWVEITSSPPPPLLVILALLFWVFFSPPLFVVLGFVFVSEIIGSSNPALLQGYMPLQEAPCLCAKHKMQMLSALGPARPKGCQSPRATHGNTGENACVLPVFFMF